jgi:imidazolonepropionase
MTAESVDVVVTGAAQVLTLDTGSEGPEREPMRETLRVLENGAVAVRGETIVAVGPTDEISARFDLDEATVVDATGCVVMPGLVDAHTHPLFAGRRYDEYALRLAGASLEEIGRGGGGIGRSVRETRAASDEELLANACAAGNVMLASGTTAIDARTGYGLTTATELRHLELLRQLEMDTGLVVVPTFLGAHLVPPAWPGSTDDYVDLVVDEMLPAVAAQGIARFCDVTCERGYFSPHQCARILAAGEEVGLRGRVHADGFAPAEGWRTAAGAAAVTADHLTFTPKSEIEEVGASETIAVFLPYAELVYFFGDHRAQARAFVEAGVPIAIATDFCSSIHAYSLYQGLALAAAWYRLSPEEVIVAATVNAAHAVGCGDRFGRLTSGRAASIVVVDVPDYRAIVFEHGIQRVVATIVEGRLAVAPRERAAVIVPGDA